MKSIKILSIVFVIGLTFAFSSFIIAKSNKQINKKTMEEKLDKKFVTVLIYLNEGMEDTFREYKEQVEPIAKRHGVEVERVIQPLKLAKGTMTLPNEIHIASFSTPESMNSMNADPEYIELVSSLRDRAVKEIIFMSCSLSDFKFNRELGTKDKTFGLAMLNYNIGMKGQFDDYHKEACAILPEFGAHFERFFTVNDVSGDFTKPDEIHLFYFDSPEGMKQMGQDPRMQKLFPKRDLSLKELNFIIGKAI